MKIAPSRLSVAAVALLALAAPNVNGQVAEGLIDPNVAPAEELAGLPHMEAYTAKPTRTTPSKPPVTAISPFESRATDQRAFPWDISSRDTPARRSWKGGMA